MFLESKHNKIITQCNYDLYTDFKEITPTQKKAIMELYAHNKIIIGCWTGTDSVSVKLSKRIKNYNKKRI